MSDFSVCLDPPIELVEGGSLPPILGQLDWTIIDRNHSELHDIVYTIGSRKYSYYPATLTTVLVDLHSEWRFALDRKDHQVEISGYPVLYAEFKGEDVRFYEFGRLNERVLIGVCKSDEVRLALLALAENVWRTARKIA